MYLGLDQDEINEEDDKVMFDVFVCKAFAARTLREAHTFSQGAVVRFAVCCVKLIDWISTFYAEWHARLWCEPSEISGLRFWLGRTLFSFDNNSKSSTLFCFFGFFISNLCL